MQSLHSRRWIRAHGSTWLESDHWEKLHSVVWMSGCLCNTRERRWEGVGGKRENQQKSLFVSACEDQSSTSEFWIWTPARYHSSAWLLSGTLMKGPCSTKVSTSVDRNMKRLWWDKVWSLVTNQQHTLYPWNECANGERQNYEANLHVYFNLGNFISSF